MYTATKNGNCHRRNRRRRNEAFPHFGNIINELMNTTMGDVVSNKNIQYSTPLVNVKEDEGAYHLYMTLPGYEKSDVKISIEKNVLHISSEKDDNKDLKYRLREFNYGKFNRRFNLSKNADEKKVTASFKDGILHITIGKKDKADLEAKTIEIN